MKKENFFKKVSRFDFRCRCLERSPMINHHQFEPSFTFIALFAFRCRCVSTWLAWNRNQFDNTVISDPNFQFRLPIWRQKILRNRRSFSSRGGNEVIIKLKNHGEALRPWWAWTHLFFPPSSIFRRRYFRRKLVTEATINRLHCDAKQSEGTRARCIYRLQYLGRSMGALACIDWRRPRNKLVRGRMRSLSWAKEAIKEKQGKGENMDRMLRSTEVERNIENYCNQF